MKLIKHRTVLLLLAAICLLTFPVSALELTLASDSAYCFSTEDFTALPDDEGIFITSVPDRNIAIIRYGDRMVCAGDALPLDALDQLTLEARSVLGQNAAISYYTVSGGRVATAKELRLSILPQKNEPPIADAGRFETYKNIPNSGKLSASDPEGGVLTFQLVKEPKRGTVEIEADGAFTYTPMENKVGKDSFTYTVTDEAGNVSDPAKISVEIKKPEDKATYADMAGDPDEYAAMWLKEEGLFTGSYVGGHLCFDPDAPVSRGDFLVMVMNLVDAEANTAIETSGFADEAETGAWLRPYITTALTNGMISGTAEDDGVFFRPHAALTKAEAMVMLQNILELPADDTAAVFSGDEQNTVPVWAEDAVSALAKAGITLSAPADTEQMSRRDMAQLLMQVDALVQSEAVANFYWVK